ncbi:MAG: hypothetical protein HQ562_02940 [Candidatus Marinimicrobia bacterium]|nr:hypothetical protein [Candidatus Neomarinimicrobiota bacterium]
MKRPSMYQRHEDSLLKFTNLFNAVKDGLPLVMQIYQTENYRDDGVIVNTKTGKRVAFDWEIRDKYFSNGKFQFKELRQFERKIKKEEIGLSLQCDREETALLVAWHEDWLLSDPIPVKLSTDYKWSEHNLVRSTRHFKIYLYSDLKIFRSMLVRVLKSETYNHTVFDPPVSSIAVNDKKVV